MWQALLGQGIHDTIGLGFQALGMHQQEQWKQEDYNAQREQFEYQQDLNELLMSREDNAVQRRVKDLQAAGLHPGLAVNQGASAQPMSPPQVPRSADTSASKLALAEAIRNSGMSAAQMLLMKSQLKVHEAEARKVNAEAVEQEQYNNLRGTEYRVGELQAKEKQEQYIAEHMAELHGFKRDQAEHLKAMTDVIRHDLDKSVGQNIRTTDHNQWLLLVDVLTDRLTKLISGSKNIADNVGAPVNVGRANDLSEQEQKRLYDLYVDIAHKHGKTPMSWKEWIYYSTDDK